MKYWLLFYFINIIVASCFHFSPVAVVYFWSSVAACDKTLKCRFSESDSMSVYVPTGDLRFVLTCFCRICRLPAL